MAGAGGILRPAGGPPPPPLPRESARPPGAGNPRVSWYLAVDTATDVGSVAAVYRFQRGAVEVILAPCLTTLSRLKDLGLHPRIAVGDGAATYAEAVRAWTGRDPVAPPAGAPRAASLIELLAVAGAVRKVD